MKSQITCAYCGKEFENKTKPFTPANSVDSFHWKCYIRFVKDRKKGEDIFEDIPETIQVNAK